MDQNRPWITNEEVKGLSSSFRVNESDILKAINEGLNKVVVSSEAQKLDQNKISRAVRRHCDRLGLPGRSELGINGAGFGTGWLVRISFNDKGWSRSSGSWRSREDVGVGMVMVMPDTGAIHCFEKLLPQAAEEGHFANLGDLLGLARYSSMDFMLSRSSDPGKEQAPLSSITLNHFSREKVSELLVGLVATEAPTLSTDQIKVIITPLLDRVETVSHNITESLCGKLIPFAADIIKKGDALELNAYNFTTTAGIADERVYRWAQAQYQPLITLLSRMKPNSLLRLVEAISLQKGEEKITHELAHLFSCSPCLIKVLTATKPDVEHLTLIATQGRSEHITDPWDGVSLGSDCDKRSVLQRFISVYAKIDDKCAENLTNFFNAAKTNALSLEQVAFSLLCKSTEDVSENPIVNILPRLLREIKAGEPLSYSELDQVETKVGAAIIDLHKRMVYPLLSKKAGFRKDYLSEQDGRNPRMDEMIEKIFQQERVAGGDYVELAMAFMNRSVEDLIMKWPLGARFGRKAFILTLSLAIMGGMDKSAIDDSDLNPVKDSEDNESELSNVSGREVSQFFYNYGLPFSSKDDDDRINLQLYFFKKNGDASWAQLLQSEVIGTVCKISPRPANNRNSRYDGEIKFSCLILDRMTGDSIGTLGLRVEKNGDSYRVTTGRVEIGKSYSDSFEKDGKLPNGYDFLATDIRAYIDGLNSRAIDPEFFDRLEGKVEEFKVALSREIHRIIDRLHPEPQGGFAEAIATAHNRLRKIFPWLNDLPTMWKLTDDVNRLQDNDVYT